MASCPGRNVKTVPVSREVTCNRCGATGLGWVKNAAGKWYLANIYSVHGELCAVPSSFHRCGEHRQVVEQIERERELQPLREAEARLRNAGQQAMLRREWEEAGRLLLEADDLKAQIEAKK